MRWCVSAAMELCHHLWQAVIPVMFWALKLQDTLMLKHNSPCFEAVIFLPLRANLLSPCIYPVIPLGNKRGYGWPTKPKHFLLLLQCLPWPAAGNRECPRGDPPTSARQLGKAEWQGSKAFAFFFSLNNPRKFMTAEPHGAGSYS